MEIHDSMTIIEAFRRREALTGGGVTNRVPGEAFALGLVWLVYRGEML